MLVNFTINGTLIPRDPEGNDMCVLFLKYGRCRFKVKCKKSHWVPPLPEEPYPVDVKPPLPNDDKVTNREGVDKLTYKLTSPDISISETLAKTCSSDLNHDSSFDKDLCSKDIQLNNSTTGIRDYVQDSTTLTNISIPSCISDSETLRPKKRKPPVVMQRRFKHVFQDDEITKCSGIEKMFDEAGVYYDILQQKVVPVKLPQTKADKHHLKLVRRLHWNNTQQLKERLSQFPPSYHLKFDRSKVNFTRLRPYIYVLVHECLCYGGITKPVKPSCLDYLIADTLIVYLEFQHATAQEAELKLQQWGARAVRARQCIDHLWHVMATSSKMASEGCAKEILSIEQEVLKGSRTVLDYACACSQALRQTTLKFTAASEKCFPRRRVCSAVRQGLDAKKKCFKKKKGSTSDTLQTFSVHHKITIGREKTNNTNVMSGRIQEKRKRSKQFKNVSLHEKKKIKTRCLHLLTTLV